MYSKVRLAKMTGLLLGAVLFGFANANATDEVLIKPDDFVDVEVMPEMIYQVQPEYPAEAKAQGIEGAVWIKALVDTVGNAIKAMVAKSSGSKALDEAALVAAKEFRFKPALKDNKPVAVWVTFKVDFVLH